MALSDKREIKPQTIPTLHIDDPEATIDSGNGHLEDLSRRIIAALFNYPHAVVLTGMRTAAGPYRTPDVVTLARAMTKFLGGRSSWTHLSFTEIKVNQETNDNGRFFTKYSRTNADIAPHTDSSYQQTPENLLGMQCVKADQEGGETTITPVEDVLRHLSKETIQTLREPIFPFTDDVVKPVLSGGRGDLCISYYRTQLEKGMTTSQTSLDEASQSALHELDQVINDPSIGFRLKLSAGDLVFIHNHKALHGRTAFDNESSRLLYRVRTRIGNPTPAINYKDVYRRTPNKYPHRKTCFKTIKPGHFEAVYLNYEGIFTTQEITSIQELEEFAGTMLKQGQFSIALPAYEELVRHMPENFGASISLSCLLEESGKTEKAGVVIKEAVAASPYQRVGNLRAGLPVIMLTKGRKNRPRILRWGRSNYQARLKGGHFSHQHLLATEKLNIIAKNLYDTSLGLAFPAPPFHLLLNKIAVPERMEDELKSLVEFLGKYPDVPVVNHPANIMQTTREMNYRRLSALDGVIFPKTVSFSFDGRAMEKLLDRMEVKKFDFPIILRPIDTHTGIGVALVNDVAEFIGYLDAQGPGSYYAIAYHNLEDDRGLFNKIRTFCIDGNYYPVANLHHKNWNVHSNNRYSVMDKDMRLQDMEKDYLIDMTSYVGPENVKRLESIREVIGLDFFGIDFTILPDGRLFIFECNAAMRHNFDHVKNFPYTAPALHKVTDAFGEMVERRLSVNWTPESRQ